MSTDPFDLRQLIAHEDDPKLRVLLMLVNTFNENLAANTIAVDSNAAAVNEIASKLDTHLLAFEERAAKDDALRNQGKGAWRVLAWVLGIVQVIGLGIWGEAKGEIKDIHAALTAAARADASVDSRITVLESVMKAKHP
jgi:hypothetical protein